MSEMHTIEEANGDNVTTGGWCETIRLPNYIHDIQTLLTGARCAAQNFDGTQFAVTDFIDC